jgi:small subunit ribosomal protein S16
MLIIRLQRVGKRNEPTFRVVLTDSKNGPKSGKFLEVLGSYDPRDKNITKIDGDKVKEWMSKGAQVSDTVNNILINEGVIEGKKINVLPKKSPIIDEAKIAAEKEAAEKAIQDAADAKAAAESAAAEKVEADATAKVEEDSAAKSEEVVVETPVEEKVAETPANTESDKEGDVDPVEAVEEAIADEEKKEEAVVETEEVKKEEA